MNQDPRPRLLTARIMAGSLFAGPVLFWIVGSWIVTTSGGGMGGSDFGAMMPWMWVAVALPAFVVALVFRRKALALVDVGTRNGVPDPDAATGALGRIQTSLVIAWALLEGPALLNGVFFLLSGTASLVVRGFLVLAAGVVTTFPRREWYEPFERVLQGESASRAG